MNYINNYAQIGGYELSMPAPQLFYPEMNGSKGCEQGSELSPRYDSYYKDDYKKSQDSIRDDPHNYYDGGDYKQGKRNEAMDLNHFYDGGDFKYPQENMRDIHNVEYGSPHYKINSASGYRSFARQNRRAKEMQARNGLYAPRDNCRINNDYPSYSDEIGHSSNKKSYWQ